MDKTKIKKCKCGNEDDFLIIEKGNICYNTVTIYCNKCNRKRIRFIKN